MCSAQLLDTQDKRFREELLASNLSDLESILCDYVSMSRSSAYRLRRKKPNSHVFKYNNLYFLIDDIKTYSTLLALRSSILRLRKVINHEDVFCI